ncbi:MAG: RNA polymerase sigma factor SigJ [Acidobacteriota bacterium]
MPDESRVAIFATHRPYLFAVAYRMLGIAEDAEDVLQEAWLRFAATDHVPEQPRGFLVTIVTRLAIDLLRSATKRREEYVGVWLPEPVRTHEVLPDDAIATVESASFAFLLLLEKLSPIQRAVLVLHDVFDYSHDEIGVAIGRSTVASRQILRRARLALGEREVSSAPDASTARELVDSFLHAAHSGDVDAFLQALAPDVVLFSDGGGKVAAVPRPLVGASRVAQFFSGLSRKLPWGPVETAELNGQPALLIHEKGVMTTVLIFDVGPDRVTTIYGVRNPDKLKRLMGGSVH